MKCATNSIMSYKQFTYLNLKILYSIAKKCYASSESSVSHNLFLVESLKFCRNYQNVTETQGRKCCWKNGANRLARSRVTTNIQLGEGSVCETQQSEAQDEVWLQLSQGCIECSFAQSCPTLCDPVGCRTPISSVHGILQARILEWIAMPSSRGSSQPRDRTQVSHTAGGFFPWRLRQ